MSDKWLRTSGSKWHKVAFEGPWLNKFARNPDWKPGMPWRGPVPFYKEQMEDRIIAACGTVNTAPQNAKVIEGNPMMQNGKRKRARICGNCVVYLEFNSEGS